MGFQRLMVNDLTDAGNQPMYKDGVYLICNGEIYNHRHIREKYGFQCSSQSDCEVILHLYHSYQKDAKNMVDLPSELDGEFAFVIYDMNLDHVYFARDDYGVRPLYWFRNNNVSGSLDTIGVCSELKGIHDLSENVKQLHGGHIVHVNADGVVKNYNYRKSTMDTYMDMTNLDEGAVDKETSLDFYHHKIRETLVNAVQKRLMSDRGVCSLLSGGLDSSLVAAIVSRLIYPQRLTTFSIGLEGSTDLEYARKVASHIGSNHVEIKLTDEEFLSAIEETIRIVESYDITTVRASVGNYLVAKYIADNTDFKVVFNGDYSDEVCGGYKYFRKAPGDKEFHGECLRLLEDIIYFDAQRSDRTISSQGLEARVPYADKTFVKTYLSVPAEYRTNHDGKIEKKLLRDAFAKDGILPDEILYRRKDAFSDGVSSPERSWHVILKNHIEKIISDKEFEAKKNMYQPNYPYTKEAYYYRKLFEKYYPGKGFIIPYFWLPKWVSMNNSVTDPSAREILD